MPKICKNWLGVIKSCIYYVRQTCEIYQVLPYSVDFTAPGLLPRVRQYLVMQFYLE